MNPGEKYRYTRHNAGEMALDLLFPDAKYRVSKPLQGEIAEVAENGYQFYLLKPHTFMNLSGTSVSNALKKFSIKPNQMVVLHDEVELSPNGVRYKFGGGHKGHNGLRSIMANLGTGDFHRIRIGVGRPKDDSRGIADYLLSFQAEKERVKKEELIPCWKIALDALNNA